MACWCVAVPASFEPYWAQPATFGPFLGGKPEAEQFAADHPSPQAHVYDATQPGAPR